MSKVVYEFSAPLRVLTPLHVGSGEFGIRKAVEGKGEGANAPPEVALLARDASSRPYLPPTTLKGALRRVATSAASTAGLDEEELFGAASDGDGSSGRIGAVLLRGARLIQGGDVGDAPYVHKDAEGELGPGVFVAARTAIDPDLGIAKDAHLFFQEMVAPGAIFGFRAVVERTGAEAEVRARKAAEAFSKILRLLAEPNGVALGKGQADGFGRVRLDDTRVKVVRWTIDGRGEFVSADASTIWKGTPAGEAIASKLLAVRRKVLRLDCRGPYIVVDASRRARRGDRGEGDDTPQIRPQRLSGELPLVMGSGISGALRARAEWLAIVCPEPIADREPATGPSSPIERLFGTTEFRGLLSIENIVVEKASRAAVTSVNLDRFSGAPIDNKLFKTEVFVGVRVIVTLALATRGRSAPSEADVRLFDRLCDDVEAGGLQLGHGGNKGFGWFEVEEVRHARQ